MNQASNSDTIKFLYSYGGRIVSRSTKGHDVMLRYEGGHTRVLSIDRSISFAELMMKFEGLCGHLVNLKCKLPKHDLDELVSIKSDEELKAGIEEYDTGDKIRVVLFPISIKKKISPQSSIISYVVIRFFLRTLPCDKIFHCCRKIEIPMLCREGSSAFVLCDSIELFPFSVTQKEDSSSI